MTYLVGVDSGGTHTNIRIVAPDGTKKLVPEMNGALTANRKRAELAQAFDDIFDRVLGAAVGAPVATWISAAGFAASTRQLFDDLLAESLERSGGVPGPVGLANDAVSLLLAHEEETVVVIAGTGSVAMARRPEGEVVTRGGDEWVVADYGSAFWIGLNGIRASYAAIEGGTDTALSGSLIEHYMALADDDSPSDMHALVRQIARELAGRGTATKPMIASFAKEVTKQAQLGDDVAQEIVSGAAKDLAKSAATVYRDLAAQAGTRQVPARFHLSGSVGYLSPFYAQAFEAFLEQNLFDVSESLGPIELTRHLNGLDETVELAGRISRNETLGALGNDHPCTLMGPGA
jgi:N-acetylglucosamine kinase-like BadF-type ATPase